MAKCEWAVTATNKTNSAATFTCWDTAPDRAVVRAIAWETSERIAEYFVTVEHMPTGVSVTYDGADYLVWDGETRIVCCECGGPCDAADAVAEDSGLARCGSVYGNGCADKGAA